MSRANSCFCFSWSENFVQKKEFPWFSVQYLIFRFKWQFPWIPSVFLWLRKITAPLFPRMQASTQFETLICCLGPQVLFAWSLNLPYSHLGKQRSMGMGKLINMVPLVSVAGSLITKISIQLIINITLTLNEVWNGFVTFVMIWHIFSTTSIIQINLQNGSTLAKTLFKT